MRASTRVVVIASVVLLSGCASARQAQPDCEDVRPPTAVMPEPAGFSVVKTAAVEPEGCGAGWELHGVLAASQAGDQLAAFSTAMVGEGWDEVPCATERERCFESDAWFVAATTPSKAPVGYPAPVGDRPQVLVSVGEAVK